MQLESDLGQKFGIGAPVAITASAGTGGTISPSGTAAYRHGTDQTFTITPSPGYGVSQVTVDGVNQGAITSYTFLYLQTDHTISATFVTVPNKTITASAGTGGTITPSGAVWVLYNGTQTFTISRNSGYAISQVTVDGVNQGAIASYTFTNVQANHTISASFVAVPTYTITASAGVNGTISPSGSVVVDQGSSQTFTITPNTGYIVSAVTVDGSSVGAVTTYTFTNVQAAHTISATFVQSTLPSGTVGYWPFDNTLNDGSAKATTLKGTRVLWLMALPSLAALPSIWMGAPRWVLFRARSRLAFPPATMPTPSPASSKRIPPARATAAGLVMVLPATAMERYP